MTREQMIDFLAKRYPDSTTKSYLETKTDQQLKVLYEIEAQKDDAAIAEMTYMYG